MRALLAIALTMALIGASYAQFNRCGYGPCPGGIVGAMGPSSPGGPAVAPSTNFRVTNTGDFRVTSTPDSRIISP